MASSVRRGRGAGLALLLILLMAAGCGADDGQAGVPPRAPEPAVGSPAPAPRPSHAPDEVAAPEEPALVAAWEDPFELALPNGWTLRDCLGDRLDLCVHDGDDLLGDIELAGEYPIDDHEDPSDPQTLLRGRAEAFLGHFRDDRALGCADFAFRAEEVTEASVDGRPAVRAGFTLTAEDGGVVERVINVWFLHGDGVWLVNVDAYVEEDGCLGPSGTDWSFADPAHLTELDTYLAPLLDHTPLPDPAAF
jgi:hypothetical protein